jgi:hypothetical protein
MNEHLKKTSKYRYSIDDSAFLMKYEIRKSINEIYLEIVINRISMYSKIIFFRR